MKTNSILAVSSLALATLVSAVPVVQNNKRDIFYTTTTEEVYETIWTTTTIWVDPTAAATSSPLAGFYELPTSSSVASAVVPTSSPAPAVVAPSSTPAPAVQAPVAEPTTPAYVAPVAAAPSPPVAPQAQPAAPAASAPASSGGSSSSSSATGSHVGDLTNYDVSVGQTSCGYSGSNAESLVALPAVDMQNGANPNANPKCGKKINIYYNGQVHQGTVQDTCPECASGSLDVTMTLFDLVAPKGDGRVKGVSWDWA
jgi:hypothetical protein